MDLVINYNRQYRIPFDRSISEHRLPDHSLSSDFSSTKGHRDYQLRKETINSYHQGIIYVHWCLAAAVDNVINNLHFAYFSHMFFSHFLSRRQIHTLIHPTSKLVIKQKIYESIKSLMQLMRQLASKMSRLKRNYSFCRGGEKLSKNFLSIF